ncbi:MAG: sulfotransferase [Crocosphaera sp.]
MSIKLPKNRIYYVLCPSFHGATLLSVILNNHSQITSLGDTFPNRNFDQICTCRKKVSECDFWQELYHETSLRKFSQEDNWFPSLPQLIKKNGRSIKPINKILNILILGLTIPFGRIIWKVPTQSYQEYYEVYLDFVNFIAKRNHSYVFVDGSKKLFKPFFMQSYSNNHIPAKIIHITRNPFNYAYSFYKNELKNTGVKSEKYRIKILEKAAKSWLFEHQTILQLKRFFLDELSYLRISYEDFCQEPKNHIGVILDFLELKYEDIIQPVIFPEKHHLMGNISIFDFDGIIRPASTWSSKLSTDEITKIHEITKPLLTEFNYVS